MAHELAMLVHGCVQCNGTFYDYSNQEDRSIFTECRLPVKPIHSDGRTLIVKVLLCHQNATASIYLDEKMVIKNTVQRPIEDVRLSDIIWGEADIRLLDVLDGSRKKEFCDLVKSELAESHYKLPLMCDSEPTAEEETV